MRAHRHFLVILGIIVGTSYLIAASSCKDISTVEQCVVSDCFYCHLQQPTNITYCMPTRSICVDRAVCGQMNGTTIYGLLANEVTIDYLWERGAFLKLLLLHNVHWVCLVFDENLRATDLFVNRWFLFSVGTVAAFFQSFAPAMQ